MHLINQLYRANYDFRQAPSRLSYMIATIPRSGSTHFAIQLWKTGVLGAPMEYLNFPAMAVQLMPRLQVDGKRALELSKDEVLAYWEKVKKLRTSPNGVFGYKMFMIIFRDVIRQYPDLFEDIQPDYVIYLTRRDRIGQAISYSRAKRSNAWFADVPNAPEVPYDFEHIRQCEDEIQIQCTYWESVFQAAQIDPIRVVYEDLLACEKDVIWDVLEQMGIEPHTSAGIDVPNLKKQSDKTTTDWRERYIQECRRQNVAPVSLVSTP